VTTNTAIRFRLWRTLDDWRKGRIDALRFAIILCWITIDVVNEVADPEAQRLARQLRRDVDELARVLHFYPRKDEAAALSEKRRRERLGP